MIQRWHPNDEDRRTEALLLAICFLVIGFVLGFLSHHPIYGG